MEVKPIEQAQQRDFDFYRLFMDHYMLQIECSTWKDESENRLNIIFPNGSIHYQVTTESYKDKVTAEIYQEEKNKNYFFFEILSKKKYGRYLEEESNGIFDMVSDDCHIYIFFFRDDVIEVVSYDEPIFVYSHTYERLE